VTVTTTMYSFDGSLVAISDPTTSMPQQGSGQGVLATNVVPAGTPVHCVFQFGGSAKSLRASLDVEDTVTNITQATLPAN
jgi:hypothetical protein